MIVNSKDMNVVENRRHRRNVTFLTEDDIKNRSVVKSRNNIGQKKPHFLTTLDSLERPDVAAEVRHQRRRDLVDTINHEASLSIDVDAPA